MASETGHAEQSFGFFLPVILGLNPTNQPQQTPNQETPRDSPDGIILVNPFLSILVLSMNSNSNSSTQSPLPFDSFLDELMSSKNGQPPASKASIEALPTVEIDGDEQCVVCLDEWKEGEKGVEMPCKHRFHKECVGKWLRIHGSCPICRYEMPVDETDGERVTRGSGGEGDGERRREAWVWLMLGSSRSESDFLRMQDRQS